MIFIKLDTLETVNKLVNVCSKYKDRTYIDIVYGRYTVDGCSVLGVASLLRNIVKIKPSTDDQDILDAFTKDVDEIGGWSVEETN